ncbi:MAG: oligopeptide transporter, OPT family [Phycisphaerales bacterium]|nr:MAG: oligopeptide transporter, OPT family [Phycisphaerales bacterium]
MREFSFLAVLLGVVIGALLAAANAFVGLKVGMTISASIPAAVMSLLILRTLLKRGTLLESNIVQTVGSAGESVASGMIFTLPALFIMGEDPAYLEMVIWGAIGGILGVCFMVPLRRVLIVKEHGNLPFPEGVACAEVLESGQRGGAGARSVIWGTVVGGVYYLLNLLGFWGETGVVPLKRVRTQFELDSSPALLGVGYILGPRVAGYMLSGAILGWFVLIPAIAFFGADAQTPVFPSKTLLISQMEPGGTDGIWENYIRYIGAGAVAIGGLISLVKSFPTIFASFWQVVTGFFSAPGRSRERTDRDFPLVLLLAIIIGVGYAMWRFDQVKVDHIGVIAVIVFTFFFVTVSSRLVGIVGSSSNPISGMTIATLLATALVYKFFVMDDVAEMSSESLAAMKVGCLSVGALVCIAISIAGDCSQDLKTGFLLKATPYKQQLGEMIGVLTSVLAIAGVLLLLNNIYGFGEATPEKPHPMLAPQANIMKILIDGVLGGNVPWTLIMIGGAAAVIVEMLGMPALPFAVGLYLPLGLSTPIMVGGVVRWLCTRKRNQQVEHDPGVLVSSGLVAGKGLMGVALAGITALMAWRWKDPHWSNPVSGMEEPVTPSALVPWLWQSIDSVQMKWGLSDAWWDALPFSPFAVLVIWLWLSARRRPAITLPPAEPPTDEPSEPEPPEPASPEVETPEEPSPEPQPTVSPPISMSLPEIPELPPLRTRPLERDESDASTDEQTRPPSDEDRVEDEQPPPDEPPVSEGTDEMDSGHGDEPLDEESPESDNRAGS